VSFLSSNGISINQNSAINYVMATSTQNNSLNMDLNGVNGGTSSTLTFAQLGATADPFSPAGVAIPEPATALLFGIGGVGAWLLRRNKKLTAEEDDTLWSSFRVYDRHPAHPGCFFIFQRVQNLPNLGQSR
jgi:hypothetical protein